MQKGSRVVNLIAALLFVTGVVVQVFLAGMVVVGRQMGWQSHIDLGHSLAGPLLLMLVTMYTGRLPAEMKRLTWLLAVIYIIQADVVIFMRVQAPALSALHPVLALFDFALGLALVRRAWALRSRPAPEPVYQPG